MTEIMKKLPIEINRYILTFKQSPNHVNAFKNGLFPIRDYMLEIVEPPIVLTESSAESDNDDLDEEYMQFILDM